MVREQNLYQIYKFTSNFICENNLNIRGYTPRRAAQEDRLVSCGDNIAFLQARILRGDERSYKDIFKDVTFLRSALHRAKNEGKSTESKIIWQAILKTLFVEDFVSVETTKKSEYRKLAKNGFYVNGIKYVRFSASAGQIRHNTVLFCKEDIYGDLYKRLMCGLDERVREINIAKLSAYFSLATSSVLWVDTPRVCVIRDFFTTLKDQKIDWITNTNVEQKNGTVKTVKSVEERTIDITMNSCDGQGLVSPEMAQRWAENMNLDYVPSSFIVRSIWTKGNVVPFDFKAYAKEHGVDTIYDRWNIPHKIEDIDVMLSESQFKQYKYYSSYEDFERYTKAAKIGWGVSRYNRKFDDEWVLANYQIIQVLDIKKEDIKELIEPTVDWINKICTGDDLYALLYSLGGFSEDRKVEYNDVYTRAQSLAMKAVVKNIGFLKDTYVQKKIYKNIVESINKAKIGKIWVRGNYSFMISDPIAQCRSALGLDPTGEIPGEHVYSKFWKDRGKVGEEIVLCRSPLLDKHEVNHCTVYDSEEANKWYKWIESGIIYSIYDLATLRASDSDFDGDLSLSTDNGVFLRGSMKDCTNPITYEKQSAPTHKICHKNFVETDIRGFGTKVGTYSNYSTIIEAMRPLFQRPDQTRQQEELLLRKKLLREINGQEIDRIKGVEAKGPPKDEWLKKVNINPEDSDEVKKEKYYHNSLLLLKKPYFFRYLYPELNTEYKRYEKKYNEISKCLYRMPIKKLMIKENKTEREKSFLKKYHKFMPVINTNCIMNILCREFENTDFDIQYNKNCVSMLPHYDIDKYTIDPEILRKIRDIYRKFCNKKDIAVINKLFSDVPQEEYEDIRFGIIDSIRDEIRNEYDELGLTTMDGLTYFYALSQSYSKFNWDVAWDILEERILDVIPGVDTYAPIECSDGSGEEFLGRKFKLVKIVKENAGECPQESEGEY